MKASSILGLNARTQLFSYPYNSTRGKKIARSKILTKRALKKAGIPIPTLYAKFREPRDIFTYDWTKLPDSFALKPSKGLGGDGIIVIKRRAKDQSSSRQASDPAWITVKRERVTIEDLKLHALDILEGAYSVGNAPDVAFVEEYVGRHRTFRKYAYRGTPDIRVIVFNRVPVMAMLRLPTKESGGRANLHQGAVGVGVDIATGITTKAIWHGEQIYFKPGTKRKLHGIKVPQWDEVLEIAVKSQEASTLGYLGVDIVLHPDRGPMVLEINSQPGLQIQLANQAGLKKRLDRIDDLEVNSPEHGVRIAKSLFAERFADRVAAKEGIKIISVWEEVKVLTKDNKKVEVRAKIDTGAWRTSIDHTMAEKLGIVKSSNVLWVKLYKSSLGEEKRKVVNLTFYLAGRKISTIASVANRKNLRTPLIIGRRDLEGFLVKSGKIK